MIMKSHTVMLKQQELSVCMNNVTHAYNQDLTKVNVK